MNRDHFWLTDRQFARIAPHLPTDTRGKPRVDDRRVISGIVHVLKSGAHWVDAPTVYGPRKTLYNRYVRWAAKGVWVNLFHSLARAGGPSAQLLIDSSAVKAHRSASGGKGGAQSGNRPLARRTDDQDPCPDRRAVPPACFHANGRQMADCTAGAQLLERLPPCRILHGDKGYDTDAIRRQIEATGATPNIPPKANRRWKNCFSPALYRGRNAIERMFCRLKDFRRIATRYDRLGACGTPMPRSAVEASSLEEASEASRILLEFTAAWHVEVAGEVDRHRPVKHATRRVDPAILLDIICAGSLQRLVNGIGVGEGVEGRLPVGMLVRGAETRNAQRRRVGQRPAEIGRGRPRPDRRF